MLRIRCSTASVMRQATAASARASNGGGSCRAPSGRRRIVPALDPCSGEVTGERTALPLDARDVEPAAMPLQRVLHDREAEPGAAELARAPGVDAVEPLGHPRQVLGRDSDPGVADLDVPAAL